MLPRLPLIDSRMPIRCAQQSHVSSSAVQVKYPETYIKKKGNREKGVFQNIIKLFPIYILFFKYMVVFKSLLDYLSLCQ